MAKGDAELGRQRTTDAFSKKYKVGDIAFSPIYRHCKILKMNKNTVSCIQVDENGKPVEYKTSVFKSNQKQKPMVVEKYLFTV
jgi:hypothetical protein